MNNKTGFNISQLIDELDSAVMSGDTEKADELADALFRLQGGIDEAAVMPAQFTESIAAQYGKESGGHKVKPQSIKRIICIAAAAALVMTLGITALATHLFGLRDFVIANNEQSPSAVTDDAGTETETAAPSSEPAAAEPSYDIIALQGYPDSSEYKASAEWRVFCQNYDTDQTILHQVGNNPNAFTERYPLYLVYSQEMADKIEEIIAKYGLTLHTSIAVPESPEEFFSAAGTGDFLVHQSGTGIHTSFSGYVYNDGTFQFDGEAVLLNGAVLAYQFANYVKGTFSDTYLNIGDADSYKEWLYTTTGGVKVSLALSETKALIIADLGSSFVTVNVLAGTSEDSGFGSSGITADDLQAFADMFDLTQMH